MLVRRGDMSHLQVALLIYSPNITFWCRPGEESSDSPSGLQSASDFLFT